MHWHRPFGKVKLGQAAINSQPNVSPCKQNLFHGRPPNESGKYGHCGMQQMPGSDILRVLGLTSENATTLWQGLLVNFYNHPKHNTSGLRLLIQGNLVLLGQEHAILPQHFVRGAKFTKFTKVRKVGKYSFAQTSMCDLALACHLLLNGILG